jgi:hypothetical protein
MTLELSGPDFQQHLAHQALFLDLDQYLAGG